MVQERKAKTQQKPPQRRAAAKADSGINRTHCLWGSQSSSDAPGSFVSLCRNRKRLAGKESKGERPREWQHTQKAPVFAADLPKQPVLARFAKPPYSTILCNVVLAATLSPYLVSVWSVRPRKKQSRDGNQSGLLRPDIWGKVGQSSLHSSQVPCSSFPSFLLVNNVKQ